MIRPEGGRPRRWLPDAAEWGVLALIALCGLVCLPLPFSGDQALFMIVARDLDAGQTLYRDVWDSKQPGVYLFYRLAGRLFGFTEVGVHTLELLYQLAFALVLLRTGRDYLQRRAARLALPLLAVGLYYAGGEERILTQVECLIGFPLYLALWLVAGGTEGSPVPPARRALASGLAGGCVAWLKLYYLPLVAGFWGLALWRALRASPERSRVWRRVLAPLIGGLALPVAGLVLWAASQGLLGDLAWTSLVYPRLMAGALNPNPDRPLKSIHWFASSHAPCLLLAAWGLARDARACRRPALPGGAVVWLVAGTLLLIGQLSWWKYYLQILAVPLAVLAARGVDAALRLPRRRLAVLACACAVALIPTAGSLRVKLERLVRHRLAVAHADRIAFQAVTHDPFAHALRQAEFVRREVAPDETIYVFGNPLTLYLTQRSYAIPINGWSPEAWSAGLWNEVGAQLERRRPDWVFVARHCQRMVLRPGRPTLLLLRADYEAVSAGERGTWYRRRGRVRRRAYRRGAGSRRSSSAAITAR